MGLQYKPMAFPEQGVSMLSSVLRSKRAVQVNIEIMRTFVRLREMLTANKDLAQKVEQIEKKYDKQFQIVFEAITKLWEEDENPKKKIGYIKEGQTKYGKKKQEKLTDKKAGRP
jgi:DNA repair protein RadC